MPSSRLIARRQRFERARALAATQLGFLTSGDLRRLGIDERTTRSWCDGQRLYRILGRVYHVVLERSQLDHHQWLLARLLAAGPRAAFTRLAALDWKGGTRFSADIVDIVVPTARRVSIPETRIHVVKDLRRDDLELVRNAYVTSDPWTFAELGQDFTTPIGPYQITNAIHACNYRDRTTDLADRIEADLARRRHIGSSTVRTAISLHRATSAGTRSRTEDRYLAMALDAWPTAPLVNCIAHVDGLTYEIDVLYAGEYVRVELDRGHHGRVRDAAADDASDATYRSRDVLTLREGWRSVWNDLAGCERLLVEALTSRCATDVLGR